MSAASAYNESSIKTLSSTEHIRLRPGMYIGRLGNGAHAEDGIYVLLKETIDNSIDEFTMGFGKKIEIELTDRTVRVRDYGRGIPLGKLLECVSIINTGAKYDSAAFQKAVGLNGVGQKAVNALSITYRAQAIRDGQTKVVEFTEGKLKKDGKIAATDERNGTIIEFTPDPALFGADFKFRTEFISGPALEVRLPQPRPHPVFTASPSNPRTARGPPPQETQRRGPVPDRPLRRRRHRDRDHPRRPTRGDFSFETASTPPWAARTSRPSARPRRDDPHVLQEGLRRRRHPPVHLRRIAVRVQEPVFESQTKTKLGSTTSPRGPSIRQFIGVPPTPARRLLHKNPEAANAFLAKIQASERERKELAGIRSLARERAKKASLHNKKLRDCRFHLGDRDKRAEDSTLFLVEGDSAAGSLTATRDVATQAVFALRGKPLNTYGLSKKVIYENEEFHLLQSALNIEDGMDGLR
jgi:topoisomerase-4 subunit B